ncbi:MAG: sodium:proton antiporter [Thermoplasmata archaeon HGW-Thermoplasmata-1]|nr:MAG: sodium:proton antiporter [Thermoplasmata archaeon HGW-Thermoplasmata-1]
MSEMSKITRTVASLAFPFILIFGLYVIIHGHLTPGGGFQGGAIVASACVMLLVAYGSENVGKRLKEEHLSTLESVGALGFIGLAFAGIGTAFFYNLFANTGGLFGNTVEFGINAGDLNTSGVIPWMNIAVGIKVMAGLTAIVLTMAIASNKHFDKEGEE